MKKKTDELKDLPASEHERRGFLKKLGIVTAATFGLGSLSKLSAKKLNLENSPTTFGGGEDYIGSIAMFAGNFAPRAWALCDGQLMSINANQALFSILGTTYGGDGRTTFALPDLRGRVPIHAGTGPGLSTRRLGARFGTETNTMTINQLANHTHTSTFTAPTFVGTVKPGAKTGRGTKTTDPTGSFMATSAAGNEIYSTTANAEMGETPITLTETNPGSVVINNNGGQQPINNIQPVLCVNFVICLQGLFPPRN